MNMDNVISYLFEARYQIMEAASLANKLGITLAIDEAATHVDHLILHLSDLEGNAQ